MLNEFIWKREPFQMDVLDIMTLEKLEDFRTKATGKYMLFNGKHEGNFLNDVQNEFLIQRLRKTEIADCRLDSPRRQQFRRPKRRFHHTSQSKNCCIPSLPDHFTLTNFKELGRRFRTR